MSLRNRADGKAAFGALAVLVLAALLRVPALFQPGIDDDEYYTLRNSEQLFEVPAPDAVASWPVLFAATRVLTELFGQGTFSLRLLPLLCGLAAVPLMFLLGRGLVGGRAAFLAALLTACWPWHQYFSGTARYYAPIFLVGLLLLVGLHRIVARGGRGGPVTLFGLLVLGTLIHPTALLAVAGGVLLLCWRGFGGLGRGGRLLLIGSVVLMGVLVLSVPPLAGPVRRVLSGAGGLGYDAVYFVLSLVFNVSLVVLLLAFLGLLELLSSSRRTGLLLALTAAVPILFLAALAVLGIGVQARYAMVAMPAALLLAGAGIGRLIAPLEDLSGRSRLARPVLVVACLLPLAPSLVSNLIDGNQHDVAAAADNLSPRLQTGQILYAEGHALLGSYLFGYERWLPAGVGDPPFPEHFGESPPPAEQLESIDRTGTRAQFVLPENVLEQLPARGEQEYDRWLRSRTRVEARIGSRRLDYHRNVLVILRNRTRGEA